ncbi:hypothetical protein E2562_000827 [Oryza meyeriana var. granulata]|uniref:Uncharacterized protein n=1 Tax=Oryza meyeriana var. granulata TaxID=110450 RepID=A0A6G1CWP2_9ORYZ|nr:hypothetical protein E2562_000827 [Oryza meyeriana var. granulata]
MAGRTTLYRPRVKNFWVLVRRLLCRCRSYKPDYVAAGEENGEKSSLLLTSRSSLEELLVSDEADDDGIDAAVICRRLSPSYRSAPRDGQAAVVRLSPGLHPPVVARAGGAVMTSGGDRDGVAAVQYRRRFMFGGFRRRLLMRRPWRPVLVAIPE